MGIRLYPSTRERVRIVLACDESVAAANTDTAIAAYLRSGDAVAEGLVIPADACHITIAPLAPDDALTITQRAGDLSPTAREAAQSAGKADAGDVPLEVVTELASWRVRQQLWTVALSLKSCDALPGVRPAREGGREVFPIDDLLRLPIDARAEIAAYVDRISALSPEGKASSGSPSGAGTSG